MNGCAVLHFQLLMSRRVASSPEYDWPTIAVRNCHYTWTTAGMFIFISIMIIMIVIVIAVVTSTIFP